ncbi:GNAT family N-acetyltransferase, partial [Chromobacterium piscinae]
MLQDLRDDCCRRLFLEVRESNAPARKLYQRCGFHQCGLRK